MNVVYITGVKYPAMNGKWEVCYETEILKI